MLLYSACMIDLSVEKTHADNVRTGNPVLNSPLQRIKSFQGTVL
jgi:hypothetical protein